MEAVFTVTVRISVSVEIVWVLPYGGLSQIHEWLALMKYVC
jgi:hypothetical protein